jgi:hypothetical protein
MVYVLKRRKFGREIEAGDPNSIDGAVSAKTQPQAKGGWTVAGVARRQGGFRTLRKT